MRRARSVAFIVLVLLCGVHAAGADRLYDPYVGRYGVYGGGRYYDDIELSRIRSELRDQRRLGEVQQRQQQQELELMREQAFSNRQISSRQACYYRSTGGFELCADLFAADSQEFSDCEALVLQRNPSCNEVPLKRRGDTEDAESK